MSNPTTLDIVVHILKKCSKNMGVDPSLVAWDDFKKVAIQELGKHGLTFDNKWKKQIGLLGGFNSIKDAYFKPKSNPDKLEIVHQAKLNRSLAKVESSHELFSKNLEGMLEKYFSKPIIISDVKPPKQKHVERSVTIDVSDTHLGAFVDPKETLSNYGSLEQSRRMAKIALETVDFKPQYRENTKLVVNLIGDIIQGLLHSRDEGMEEAEQFCLAVWILTQFICYLANHYGLVEIYGVSGNHDRILAVHPDRAVHKKWNSEATKIYYAVKRAVEASGYNNVVFKIHTTPWMNYTSLGHNYWATHGDSHIKVGYLNASIATKALEAEINKINAEFGHQDIVTIGHVHFGTQLRFGNGTTVLTNPALIPPDAYAQHIGIWGAQAGQWLYESTEDYALGDSRFLMVDKNTDRDASLDKVIKPYLDFNRT